MMAPNFFMKYNFYVNDDKTYDNLFIQHCLTLHWENLKSTRQVPKKHIIWSDGCSSQFKSQIPWFFSVNIHKLLVVVNVYGIILDWGMVRAFMMV